MNTSCQVYFLLQDVPALYGAEQVTLSLMAGLRARGADVRVLLMGESRLGGPQAMARAAGAAGLPLERIEVGGRFSWALVRAVRRRLRAAPGAIVHTVGYKAHLHGRLASWGVAPSVTTMHGWLVRPAPKERLYEWMEMNLFRHDDAVICLTSFYEELLLRRGVPRARLHRIPTGLETLPPVARTVLPAHDPFTVALAGRLSWEKNHELLLRAAAGLRGEGVRLRVILAGTGPEQARIEALVAQLGLGDTVELAGYVPMSGLLPRVQVVCLTSRIENMPLSLMEAMAWGRPVVATQVGGVPDLVRDGATGFLVPSDDVAALQARLRQLAESPALCAELGRAARRHAEAQFALPLCLDRHLALYRQLLHAGGPA